MTVDATLDAMRSLSAPAADRIVIRALKKSFPLATGTIVALDGFDLRIKDGEFVCIVGPSGCGKTTLLRILAELEVPTGGDIVVERRSTTQPLTSMIFQEMSLFPWMRVRDNVGFGLDVRKVPTAERNRIVDHFIGMAGLARFADAYPYQLSGGMKQRVSVARAFANDPEILLMDEPFAALDEQTKIVLQEELLRLWTASRKTVLFITHSIDEALVLADRVILMSGQPGRIIADIAVDFPRPRRVEALKADATFGRLWHDIWMRLRQPALQAASPESPAA